MLNKHVIDSLNDVRYLIMSAISDSFYCREMENCSGYTEPDFSRVCSLLYHFPGGDYIPNKDEIIGYIDAESLKIARCVIYHAEAAFGLYSKENDDDIYSKYIESTNFLDDVLRKIQE